MKKTSIYRKKDFITKSRNLIAVSLLSIDWGASLILLVLSKRLELNKQGLQYYFKNFKKFQNLKDFQADYEQIPSRDIAKKCLCLYL